MLNSFYVLIGYSCILFGGLPVQIFCNLFPFESQLLAFSGHLI